VFPFPWKTVIKAFWIKYPSKELDMVKFKKVIEFKNLEDNKMYIKSLIYTKNILYYVYSVEEMICEFDNQKMQCVT